MSATGHPMHGGGRRVDAVGFGYDANRASGLAAVGPLDRRRSPRLEHLPAPQPSIAATTSADTSLTVSSGHCVRRLAAAAAARQAGRRSADDGESGPGMVCSPLRIELAMLKRLAWTLPADAQV